MIAEALRAAHAPDWIVFVVIFGLYICTAGWWMINGFTRELFGSPLPHMGRIHKVVYNFHTGLPVHNMKSHGDQRKLKRVAGSTSRATPDGSTVYFTPWKRWQRALRNNIIVTCWLLASCGMAIDPAGTVRAITLLILFGLIGLAALLVRKQRERARRSRPVSRPAIAQTKPAKLILGADTTTIGTRPKLELETKPQLEGVPPSVIANLLASRMGVSAAEVMNRLRVSPDSGSLVLPDTYAALKKEREPVEEVIEAHTVGKVRFAWKTTETPRVLEWFPVTVPVLPTNVRFRDYLSELERLGARETGLGLRADKSLYIQSHNGDLPWWCRFMGSGTGKSMSFLVKAAQIAHKDPKAEIHCFDTKQVSFEALHGIPGVHIYDNPVTGMGEIWNGLYSIAGLVESRYTAVREKRKKLSDFNDVWVFADEGNHLGGKLKTYWTKDLGESSASPSIWAEAIAPILQQGRQARVFGEWMFQDLTDRAMGGQSLKFAFSAFCAAGFMPNQFTRTIGPPAEECLEGPGRILVCQGNKRTWTQGFYDDEQWLHDYALENRRDMAA
jgi:hypothetical protein